MAMTLQGKRIAILAADGVERVELERPRDAVHQAGGHTELLSPKTGEIQARNNDLDAAGTFTVDRAVSDVAVGVICHGPWTLVEAGVAKGRTLTSYPSLRTDLRNAGADVVDEEVAIDGNLISSRSPDDLPAFCQAIVAQFAKPRTGAS
ncbi:DJ-1/PfpI family protein [Rhodococcus sp. T7]|uniref:DJ-1/PfpI family protein n=1 Tax=Rhodococcus sp. T7 TaxID=627444 RepID=UPI001358167C|nr:DJ-1/PfpI family protein [Rhodococcus sp. T7]KAF0965681.1 hypothetical protein MLGJGCBP_01147 [Rhodococcus sp. T7]